MNSRPLTRVNVESQDMILTPNHFLLGNLGGAVEPTNVDWSTKKKWKAVHSLLNKFWEMFKQNYMPELRTKKKWKELNPNLSEGDLVLELDKDVPRGEWRLAIIQEVIPSLDKNVRKIRIKYSAGSFIRPITQVCSLEINANKKFISEAEVISHIFC